MPITNRNGDTITVTASENEIAKMTALERQAREGNFIVEQHTASLIDEQKDRQEKPGYLKIHKLMKFISSGGGNNSMNNNVLSTTTTPTPEVQIHNASITNTNNNTITASSDNVLKTYRLMKKIVNPTFSY